jgi:uncharacterized phage protein gp47/JayE
VTIQPSDIATQIINSLALSEPDLDTSIGQPVRKMIDAFSEVIAEGYADQYLLDYQYDIDTKRGADLDDFVALFGFTRLPAKRATGIVTFQRQSPATSDIIIPIGTQVATGDSIPVVVQTVVPAVLVQGDTSIDVPVQAMVGGALGNISADAITRFVTALEGITAFTNPVALSGGANAESDAQLRDRFKKTIFRNLAGTEQNFLAIALDDPDVTQANVLGASNVHREQVELVGGVGVSVFTDARYIFDNATFGTSIDDGDIFTPGVQYTFSSTIPPTVTSLDSMNVPDGVYELEFEYVSLASRNDPALGVRNCVDVWVNGTRAQEAVETTIFQSSRAFNSIPGDPMDIANFLRPTGDPPQAGNYFIPCAFAPVIDPAVDDQLIINGITYMEGTDFFLVNDITNKGGTPDSLSGIELISAANGASLAMPPDGVVVPLDYTFNAIPRDIQQSVASWRLVTTDVLVHQANVVRLDVNIAVIFLPGYNQQATYDLITAAVQNYFAGVTFAGVVQVSDILEVIGNVTGVDAVRFLTDADAFIPIGESTPVWAIQKVNTTGALLVTYDNGGTPKRAIDVLLGDDQVPVLNEVNISVKAENTFWSNG